VFIYRLLQDEFHEVINKLNQIDESLTDFVYCLWKFGGRTGGDWCNFNFSLKKMRLFWEEWRTCCNFGAKTFENSVLLKKHEMF